MTIPRTRPIDGPTIRTANRLIEQLRVMRQAQANGAPVPSPEEADRIAARAKADAARADKLRREFDGIARTLRASASSKRAVVDGAENPPATNAYLEQFACELDLQAAAFEQLATSDMGPAVIGAEVARLRGVLGGDSPFVDRYRGEIEGIIEDLEVELERTGAGPVAGAPAGPFGQSPRTASHDLGDQVVERMRAQGVLSNGGAEAQPAAQRTPTTGTPASRSRGDIGDQVVERLRAQRVLSPEGAEVRSVGQRAPTAGTPASRSRGDIGDQVVERLRAQRVPAPGGPDVPDDNKRS
jgi:hypothetical protein